MANINQDDIKQGLRDIELLTKLISVDIPDNRPLQNVDDNPEIAGLYMIRDDKYYAELVDKYPKQKKVLFQLTHSEVDVIRIYKNSEMIFKDYYAKIKELIDPDYWEKHQDDLIEASENRLTNDFKHPCIPINSKTVKINYNEKTTPYYETAGNKKNYIIIYDKDITIHTDGKKYCIYYNGALKFDLLLRVTEDETIWGVPGSGFFSADENRLLMEGNRINEHPRAFLKKRFKKFIGYEFEGFEGNDNPFKKTTTTGVIVRLSDLWDARDLLEKTNFVTLTPISVIEPEKGTLVPINSPIDERQIQFPDEYLPLVLRVWKKSHNEDEITPLREWLETYYAKQAEKIDVLRGKNPKIRITDVAFILGVSPSNIKRKWRK
jgi:hypothetical protein